MQGAPYSADLIHCGSENPRFEVVLPQSSLMKFKIRDNKRDILVELPAALLLDRTFDLQEWYAQKMRDLKVNNEPGLAEDYINDKDCDSDHDPRDDDDNNNGPSPPGGGTSSLVRHDRRCPTGDPGSPREGWLSWHYSPEEVEAEWDK